VHFLAQVGGHHQLFLADLLVTRGAATSPARRYDRRGAPPKPAPAVAPRPADVWVQPFLFDGIRRDYTRFDRDGHVEGNNPWLAWARHLAHRLAEARGWRRGIRVAVDRALVVVLSGHAAGDIVRYSELSPALRALDISVERTVDVLVEMGIFCDDRRPSFEDWLARKLDGFTARISRETERWLRTLQAGGPRSHPRNIATAWQYANMARPALLEWSTRYDHLREVTRDDVIDALAPLRGQHRQHTLIALRSLFAWAHKNSVVFRNPTSRIRVGDRVSKLIQPLSPEQVAHPVEAATDPAGRLIVALAAVHAARTGAIRALRLDDVDLGNRRLTIAGRVRPLDDLTHQLLVEWLQHRRGRWPNTANPHLIINQMSAVKTSPVSTFSFRKTLRGQPATLERLRVDRQLEEALTHGPDPLHLAAVFGLDDKTAIRYANAARQILETEAERHAITDCPEPPASTHHQTPTEVTLSR
jgi:integrase